jgi:hypothetical protein
VGDNKAVEGIPCPTEVETLFDQRYQRYLINDKSRVRLERFNKLRIQDFTPTNLYQELHLK